MILSLMFSVVDNPMPQPRTVIKKKRGGYFSLELCFTEEALHPMMEQSPGGTDRHVVTHKERTRDLA